MQRPIRPKWLIRQARDLTAQTAQGQLGQPRNGDLRRAVSAAYYAVFHQTLLQIAYDFLPAATDSERWRFTRHIQHSVLKSVFEEIDQQKKKSPTPSLQPEITRLQANTDFQIVADAFVSLQESRHSADYDHTWAVSKPSALLAIKTADDAIARLKNLAGTPDFHTFAMVVVLRSSPRKT